MECLVNDILALFLGKKLFCFLQTGLKYSLIFSGTEFGSPVVLPNMSEHLKLNIDANVHTFKQKNRDLKDILVHTSYFRGVRIKTHRNVLTFPK